MERSKEEVELIIPCHWDKEVIDKIITQNNHASAKVTEVYGVLAEGGPIGHGRSPDSVVKVTRQNAIKFRKYLKKIGLRFTYLLNAPFRFNKNSQDIKVLDSYLNWILGEVKPDALIISSYKLMKYVRLFDIEVPIYISTIAGVKNVEDLQKYLDIRPAKVIPHHDVGKNWRDLRNLVLFCRNNNIKIELMVTESCLYKCPFREVHYKRLAYKCNRKDSPFHLTCNAKKLINPSEFLLAGGFVRPEDLSLFKNIGVNQFKITGRSKPADWLPETVKAYQFENYEGNILRLSGIDPSLKMEDWFYIDNKGLEGFMKSFPHDRENDIKREYCETWAVKLFKEKKLYAKDGSQYYIQKGKLRLVGEGGSCISQIIRRERD